MLINKFLKNNLRGLLCALSVTLLTGSLPVYATEAEDRIIANQAMTVESNQWTNWPTGPIVSAESAILMEAETGVILYSKNIHTKQFPASTTKILTTLIAIENCALDEMVTFSYKATHDIDPGSNHIGLDANEQLPMEDCLKAILIRSANEVSFGVAEHIAKDDWEAFAPIMNERAKELGCLNSNFVNPNGLPNEEHVSTAYDLAMIGRAFFANDILCKMTQMKQLHLYPSEHQPDEIWENNQMALIPGKQYAYDALVGCKTGYTNAARSCLVSCAEKNGLKLICVVLKDEAPYQYEDTIALFEYGFSNFEKRNVSQNKTKYNVNTGNSFYDGGDIFGNSEALLTLNETDYIILPKGADFSAATPTIQYDTTGGKQAALLTYQYYDAFVGEASVDFTLIPQKDYAFEAAESDEFVSDDEVVSPSVDDTVEEEKEPSFFFINWKKVLIFIGIILGCLAILSLVLLFLKNYQISSSRRSRDLWVERRRGRRRYRQNISVDLQQKRKQQIAEAKRRQRARRR